MDLIRTMENHSWQGAFDECQQREAMELLENGGLLFFPHLAFELTKGERRFLVPAAVDAKTKNVSFDARTGLVRGSTLQGPDANALQQMLARYARQSLDLVRALLPHYVQSLQAARTSYRPVEVQGRQSSWRKDDTRLHVDAFPSSPNQGQRLLRVFSNVNPNGKDRVWRIGEPFERVAQRFVPNIAGPIPGLAQLLLATGITKSLRTGYDHLMLHIHDRMKADGGYQANVSSSELRFSAGSTWIVFTDCVSHAVMSGQFMMEQTFLLPIEGMLDPARSPLRVLERVAGRALI